MKILGVLGFWIAVTTAVTALAGNSSGGGGSLSRYESNPWFLKNTEDVYYCINHDPATFHLSAELAKKHVREAFVYWTSFFRKWEEQFPKLNFKVATQNFIHEVTCDEKTDIKFQLGTLDPDQKKILGDPSYWAGAAKMTSYDLVNLKAKGFIYFGADSGAERMVAAVEIAERPWSPCDGLPFRLVALHEVAHIFGLQHVANSWLLEEGMPQEAVSSVFNPTGICKMIRDIYEDDTFFVRDLVPHRKFYAFSRSGFVNGRASITAKNQWKNIEINLHDGSSFYLSEHDNGTKGDWLIRLTLPKEQIVFPNFSFGTGSYTGFGRRREWDGSYQKEGTIYRVSAYTPSSWHPAGSALRILVYENTAGESLGKIHHVKLERTYN